MAQSRTKTTLSQSHPKVAAKWHPAKNGGLTPDLVASGTSVRAWWICPGGPDHEWEAVIVSRTYEGTGCPFSAGKKVSVTNSLMSNRPELAAEWHIVKNGLLTPEQITFGSNKKVWWQCPKGPDHEWQSTVTDRTSGANGCPFCSGYRASVTNSLTVMHHRLAAQWHPTKNGDLTPDKYASGSRTRVWWKCGEGSDHEWQAVIANRAGGNGCPFCSGYRLSVTNSLASVSPQIASQWHPTKNGHLRPDEVVAGSARKVWWKCPKGENHEWKATINSRTNLSGRSNCPLCSGRMVGKDNNLTVLFPNIAAQWHPTKNEDLKPGSVTRGSGKKVWWKCPEGHGHEWQATIKERTRDDKPTGCPFCSRRRPCP